MNRSNIVLSICIPTYNRGEILYNTLNHLIHFKSNEVEFIVSDNCSPDNTEELIRKIKDPRLKYYRRSRNYGAELNFTYCIRQASGGFVFLLSDEDIIEESSLNWIINMIKKQENITLFLGKVVLSKTFFYKYEDKTLKKGPQSLEELFFTHGYLSGIVLKKSSLNLDRAEKYDGSSRIHEIMMLQSMLQGDTLLSSKIFCREGKYVQSLSKKGDFNKMMEIAHKQIKATPQGLKNYPYYPLDRYFQLQYRKCLIYELTKDYPKTKTILFEKLGNLAAALLVDIFFQSPTTFFKILLYFLKNKEFTFSRKFWKNIANHFIINLKKNLKLRFLYYFLYSFLNPFSSSDFLIPMPVLDKYHRQHDIKELNE